MKLINSSILMIPTDGFGGSPHMVYSADGRYLALAEGRRGYSSANVLDTGTGKILCSLVGSTPAEGRIGGINFSPDGRWVKFSGIKRWLEIPEPGDADKAQSDCSEEDAATHSLFHSDVSAYSSDGTRVATLWDNKVSVWDMATQIRILEIPNLKGPIQELVFTSDGRHVVSRDSLGEIAILQIPEELTGNAFEVVCAYLPDHDLSTAVADYPVEIDNPICGGEYDPPMPEQQNERNGPFPPR